MRTPSQPDRLARAAWETEQLYTEHSGNLMRYLQRGMRIDNDLEDIAQETFVRFFQARCNGEEIQSPKAWLFRVGRHLALDFAKKSKPVLLDDDAWKALEARQASVPVAEDRSLRSSKLPWHLLSAMEKECLLLRAEGLSFREVAETMDISISTVSSYVARAIKKFQKAVAEPSETPEPRRVAPLR